MTTHATQRWSNEDDQHMGWPWYWLAVIALAVGVFLNSGCMFAAGAAAGGGAGYVAGHEAGEDDVD